jgi:hypothetical protein
MNNLEWFNGHIITQELIDNGKGKYTSGKPYILGEKVYFAALRGVYDGELGVKVVALAENELDDYEILAVSSTKKSMPHIRCKCVSSKMGERKLPKMLIIGHARHGKDSFAEILRDKFGYSFQSSSQAASDIFLYTTLKDKYGYQTSEECFEDRVNHRAEWKELICDYNKDDRAKLAKGILEHSDCYVGMRDRAEINECLRQGLFDLIIWVDASKRLPKEPSDSFDIDESCADIIIENNGTYEEFLNKALRLGECVLNLSQKLVS